MKAPEGFASRARREARCWYGRLWGSLGADIGDMPYAAAWRDPGAYKDDVHAATWWLLLAELADDGQEAPE